MTCPTLNCYIWESGCSVDWTVTAAWVQAILSAAAIWWASKTALTQVSLQFKNDKLIREAESLQEQIVLIGALAHNLENIQGAIVSFFQLVREAQFSKQLIAKHHANNYMHVFQDALEDIQKISIYGLRNEQVIFLYVAIRLDIRQLQFNCKLIIESKEIYSPEQFTEFASTWQEGVRSFGEHREGLANELQRLINQQTSIMQESR